jgi:hypothetical protein
LLLIELGRVIDVDRCRSCWAMKRVLARHILPVAAVVRRSNCRPQRTVTLHDVERP